jgi:hypothetical protein
VAAPTHRRTARELGALAIALALAGAACGRTELLPPLAGTGGAPADQEDAATPPTDAEAGVGADTRAGAADAGCADTVAFGPPIDIQVGVVANAVAFADIDGDLRPDLVVGRASGGGFDVITTVRVGDGRSTDSFVSLPPDMLAVGDVDGDHHPDVVAVSHGAGVVSVLSGDGAGSFHLTGQLSLNQAPDAVALADLDRDGRLDLLTTADGLATVRAGNGDGTFGPGQALPASGAAAAIAAGDLDGDGWPDLVVANPALHDVTVILRPGSPAGSSARTIDVGVAPSALALGDVDGDTRLDLAIATDGSTLVRVMTGDGNGGLTAGSQVIDVGTNAASIAFADEDFDGLADLAVADPGSAYVQVFFAPTRLGGGRAAFLLGSAPIAVALGDVDRDGALDALVGTRDTLTLLLGNHDGTFRYGRDFVYSPNAHGFPGVAIADLNGDGQPDLAALDNDVASVDVLIAMSAGVFTAPTPLPSLSPQSFLAVGDVDGDHLTDLIVATSNPLVVGVLPARRAGVFDAAQPAYTAPEPERLASGDFNEDGRIDLAELIDQTQIDVLVPDAGVRYRRATTLAFAGKFISPPVIGDVDGDGHLDVVVTTDDGRIQVVSGHGDGTFSPARDAGATPPLPQQTHFLHLADVDGDGRLDLITTADDGASIQLALSDGTFDAPTRVTFGSQAFSPYASALATGDVNGDAALDLVVANRSSNGVTVRLGVPRCH